MSIDKQKILYDLNLKQSLYSSANSTPLMFSRDSSMETLSSFNINFHSHNSTYTSEHSTNPSGILSPSDIPDSPPRGRDDDDDDDDDNIHTIQQQQQQRTPIQPLNNTRSTGITVIERSNNYIDIDNDNDVDSIRNYATSPLKICYDGDNDDDNDSIHSSLSSLTLPPPSLTTTTALLSNINDLKKLKHNLSVINEESLHEQNERRKSIFNISNTTTDNDDNDDDDDDDQKGKRLLFELIRQRLPHHISLTNTSNSSSSKLTDDDKSKTLSSSSSSSLINDQTMREDSSNHGLSSHDITIPSSSSAMQESGYDSLLPSSSAPKRSLSNASLSTTRSIMIKKKHRCDEENDDPMNGINDTDFIDDDDEHYDKKAGEALLRNLIAQVLPSFNPRYLNSGDDDNDEDEIMSNPRRPSPTSQVYSSSNASSIRSVDIEIEINKKSEKNLCIRSNKKDITDKIHSKRSNIHRPVHPTKSSELRRLQTHSRR